MKRIGVISDTHGFLDPTLEEHFSECDEIWHAGDIGKLEVTDQIEAFKPLRCVYGNIDDAKARRSFPLDLRFTVEGLDVFMTHIGGYPGRYNKRVTEIFKEDPPGLFICGHSHIMKVMMDKRYGFLHINPGACGQHGFHKIRTMARFTIKDGKVADLQAIELGTRGQTMKK